MYSSYLLAPVTVQQVWVAAGVHLVNDVGVNDGCKTELQLVMELEKLQRLKGMTGMGERVHHAGLRYFSLSAVNGQLAVGAAR